MENIKIGLQIDSNTKSETADAKKLHDQLKQAADAAAKIKVGGVAKAGAQPASKAMQAAQPVGSEAVREYGSLRGTAGATGASARDFANQAQGLSGLVRLYAVYAANVYAVTAAFNALSRAMDTTNMIRGLDQLGAASGRSLAGLSKQFAAAAGNAISAREAIEAVAKTSAAGLSGTDIVRLGTAAQKASAALGVNLTDAVSRLSRGITKLEPELLDELGIFTKIEPAVEKYARSVGKASSQLSDFERRQAFATAVLEEAEQKFGKIDIDVNPYSKLAATFANLAQSGLELVNKVLIPIVNVLSSNPVALATVVATFGASLIKNVIPALKDVNRSLTQFQKQAGERAQGQYKQALTKLIDVPKLDDLNKKLNEASNQAYDQLDKTKANLVRRLERLGPIPVKLDKLLKLTPIDTFDPKLVQSMLGGTLTSRQDQKAIQAYINSMQSAIAADAQFGKVFEDTNNKVNKRYNIFERLYSPVANLQAETNKQFLAGVRSTILGNTLQTASTEGSVTAFKQLYNTVQAAGKQTEFKEQLTQVDRTGKEVTKTITRIEQGMGTFQKATTFAAGSAAIVGTQIGRIGSNLLGFLPYIGLAVAAFEGLKAVFDTSQKESERFAQSLGVLESAIENVDKAFDSLSKRKAEKFYDIEAINAVTNAFTDLSKSLTQLISDSQKLAQTRSKFSEFAGRLTSLISLRTIKTDEEKLSIQISSSTARAIQLAAKSGELDSALQDFSEALSIDPSALKKAAQLGTKELEKVIRNGLELATVQGEKGPELAVLNLELLAQRGELASQVQTKFAQSLQLSTDKINDVKTGLENLTKEIDSYTQSLSPSDPFAKIGTNLLTNAPKIYDALENSKNSILALQQIINSSKTLAVLPEDIQTRLLATRSEVNKVVQDIGSTEKYIEDLQNTREKAIKANKQADVTGLDQLIRDQEQALTTLRTRAKDISREFSRDLLLAFTEAGIKQLEISSKFAAQQAGVTAQRGRVGVLAQAGVDTAKMETDLRLKEIGIQRNLVDANLALAIQTAKLAAELELSNALAQLSNKREELRQKPKDTKLTDEIAKLETSVVNLERQSYLISSGQATSTKGIREIRARGSKEDIAALSGSGLQGLVSALFGAEAQKAGFDAQAFIARLEGRAKEIGETTARQIKQLQLEEGPIARDLEATKEQEKLKGLYDEQLASKRLALEADLGALKLRQEFLEIAKNIQIIDAAVEGTKEGSEARRNAEVQRQLLLNQITEKALNFQQKNTSAQIKDFQDRQSAEKELFEFNQKSRAEDNRLISEQNQLRLEAGELELTRLSSLEGFNKRILIDEKARIDTLKLQNQEQTALNDINVKAVELEFRKKQLAQLGELGINTQEASRRLEIESTQLEAQRNLIINKNSLQFAAIEQTRQLAQEQERYNQTLQRAQELSEAIKTAFEGIGTAGERIGNAFSNLVTVLANMEVQSEKNAQNVSAYEQAVTKAREAEQNATEPDDANAAYASRIKAEDDLAKAKSKQAKDELSANAKVVGSVKMLFKEKTAAYKILGAVEKAMHLTRLAMEAKELFTKITGIKLGVAADIAGEAKETATSAAGAAARAPITITEIFGKITSQLGIFGPPVAAAIIASIFGAMSGGKSVPVIGAQQQQEVQGTAMGYNAAGEKVQQRAGVFGDVDAKSESIANSLEIIKNNSVRGMDYNDKLLKSFERLSKSIQTVAIQAYQQPGLLRGPVPGVAEGTVDTRMTKAGAGIGAVVGLLGGPFGAILGGIVGSLFGKKVTNEVVDSGIKLKGSFLDVARGEEDAVQGFARVQTTTKRSFGRKKVSVADLGIALDPALAQTVEDAFGSALDTAYETAEVLGLDISTLNSRLGTLNLTDRIASLRGLKGEELATELQAFFGGIIDEAFDIGFGDIAEKYRKFGEGAAETVIRVVDTNRKIEQQLGNISGTGIAKNLGLDITETLADAAGGLQSFIEKTDGFIDKFLTDAEKLAPVQRAVSTELNRLGLGWVDTREEFANVVQGLDLTTESGEETFTALINLSEGFDTVVTATENAAKKANEALSQTFENVKNELRTVAEQRISELKGARDEFQNFAKSLREYSSSLKTGNLSPLTPQQQYEILRQDFLTTQAQALAGDTGAIGRLSNISSSFLQASQKMFGSSAQYVSDFDLVSSSVDIAASFAEQQVDIANDTLAEIKSVVGGLVDLKTETEKIPAALSGLGVALTAALDKYMATPVPAPVPAAMGMAFDKGIRKYALGGVVTQMTPFQYSQGIGVMGEAGPEAIMPLQRMPGGELGVKMGGAYAEQLDKLNKQVAELTKVVANGAVINAQATDRNTQAVVSAVNNTAETVTYQSKLINRTRIV